MRQGGEDHVVVVLIQALLVLGAIDGAQADADADAREVFRVGLEDAFQVRVDQQDFKLQRLATGIHQTLARQRPAGLLQQQQGAAQGVPRDAGAGGLRHAKRLGKELGWQLLTIGRKQQPLAAFRLAGGRELAVGVIAAGADIGIVEQGAVGPLEVEQQAHGLAHLALGKQRAAGVHHQRLGLRRNLVGDFGADHFAAFDVRELVAVGPVLGLMLDIEIELPGFEGFEGDVAVAVELHLDPIEIVLAAVDGQLLAPPILHPFKHHAPAGYDLGDAVRPAAQWRGVGGGLEVAVLPVMLGQDWQFAQVQDQQWIVGLLEHEADAMAAKDVDPFNVLQVGAVLRVALLDQQAVGKGHVVSGDRHTVVKGRFGAQVEHHPAAVFAVLDGAGDQPVTGGRLVTGRVVLTAAGHQRLVQLTDAVLGEVGCRRRAAALEGVRVEGVEGAESHDPHATALGGVRVHPGKVGKAGGVLEFTELGIAMTFAQVGEGAHAHGQAGEQQEGTHQAQNPIHGRLFGFLNLTVTACIDRKKTGF